MNRTLLMLLGVVAGCGDRQGGGEGRPHAGMSDSADHAFHQVQRRGQVAMGVDQYTSYHRFEPLPDGGRITLERDSADHAGVAQIRGHMREIAVSFRAGNFALPGFVHGRKVPGTGVMRSRRAQINYIPRPTPSGGQLRIVSRDSMAVRAIHEFMAFQRHDHRAETHGPAP